MKKLLFFLFFPITVPVYLLIKAFGWLKDSFVPFMQYDVIPFVDEHIISEIKEYIDFKATQMQEKKEAEKQDFLVSEYKVDEKDSAKEFPTKTYILDESLQKDIPAVYADHVSNSAQDDDLITLDISVTVQTSADSIVGHPPPFTPEEYKKIRYAESKEQSNTLKAYYGSDRYNERYTCGEILNFWGAKYRLLAIDCFEYCLRIQPTANLYRVLGDLYEKDHKFQKAQIMYQNEIKKNPCAPAAYVFFSRCLLKQNKIDEAIAFLTKTKSTEYYLNPKPHSCFNLCIDEQIKEYTEKKNQGYIYKPRKKKFDYIEVGSMSIDDICSDYLKKWQ